MSLSDRLRRAASSVATLPPVSAYAAPELAPPPPTPQSPVGAGTDFESVTFKQAVPADGNNAEVPIYSTRKRWRACDVYATIPFAMNAGDCLTFKVYAVAGGIRTLVSSGRLGLPQGTDPTPRWVCAARAVCDRFEVTCSFNDLPAVDQDFFQVSIVASDQAIEPPPWVGVQGIKTTTQMDGATSIGRAMPGAELVRAILTNNGAPGSPLWLIIRDSASGPVNGQAPLYVVGCHEHGATVDVDLRQISGGRRLVTGVAAAISTTPNVVTLPAVDTGIWGVWYR